MNPVTDTIQAIAKNKEDFMREQRYAERHLEDLEAMQSLEKAVVSVAEYLTRYFSAYIGKTEVLNPITSVSTPDIVHVVKSVRDLTETVKTSQLDLSPVLDKLGSLESQLQAIPKDKIELPEQKEAVTVTNLGDIDLSKLETAIQAIDIPKTDLKPVLRSLEAVVKAVGAVNIPETDMRPMCDLLENVVSAVKAIKLDVPETDLSTLEAEAKKQTKTLEKLLAKPNASSDGGASSWPAVSPDGIAQPLQITRHNELITVNSPQAKKITVDGSITYVAVAVPGTDQSTAAWQVQKIDDSVAGTTTITWADGNANYDNTAEDLTLLSYS